MIPAQGSALTGRAPRVQCPDLQGLTEFSMGAGSVIRQTGAAGVS